MEERLLSFCDPAIDNVVHFSYKAVELSFIFVLDTLAFVFQSTEISEDVFKLTLGCGQSGLSIHYD